jgi:hypothetical protein
MGCWGTDRNREGENIVGLPIKLLDHYSSGLCQSPVLGYFVSEDVKWTTSISQSFVR